MLLRKELSQCLKITQKSLIFTIFAKLSFRILFCFDLPKFTHSTADFHQNSFNFVNNTRSIFLVFFNLASQSCKMDKMRRIGWFSYTKYVCNSFSKWRRVDILETHLYSKLQTIKARVLVELKFYDLWNSY